MSQQVKPKKALGQHFLTDLDIARRIAATLDDYKGLPVMEVGPGMGVLTQFLMAEGHDISVAEIDGESVDYLRSHFPELEGRIIDCDFLKLDLAQTYPDGQKFCVIGNILSCARLPQPGEMLLRNASARSGRTPRRPGRHQDPGHIERYASGMV